MKPLAPPPNKPRISHQVAGYSLIAAAVVALAAQPGFAQEAPPAPSSTAALAAAPDGDPPGRIARLNYMAGTVTTEPAGASDWSYAQINRPLTTGDQLWNDQNARSELHIGSTAVRLGENTSLDVLNLDDTSAQLKVAQGTLSTRVRELAPGSSYEIDTPNLALGMNGPGDYRVDVAPDGSSTSVTVRSGSAVAYGDGGQAPIAAGQQIRFAGTGLQQLSDARAPGPDELDQWAATRDASEDRSVSARYVSREIPGYQDLDANGTWRETPQYGAVWTPRATPAGWAPYRDGHWVWQAPWGWTWVDDQPWGFAPYHYGRWVSFDESWAWVPGPLAAGAPPVYAPALVGFVGDGEDDGGVDWGVNLALGGAVAAGVAWFPLGPGEPWHPHWGGGRERWSRGYYDRVNRPALVNDYRRDVHIHNNTYVNYRAPGGLTAMPTTAFVRGQPAGRFAQKVDPRQWHNARINPGAPGIAPVRESFGADLRRANYRPPASLAARPVVATRNPALPAAYHDDLAQRFAQGGGRVPGGGQPVVRTAVPAQMGGAPGMPGVPGARGAALPVANVRVVQSHVPGRPPGMAAGAPGMAGANGQPGRQPGQFSQIAPTSNGVPRPPQASGAHPGASGYLQQHSAPQVWGAVGRSQPAWTQSHAPMEQQAQRGESGGPQRAGQPGFAQQAGVPHPPQNPAAQQQARQPDGHPQTMPSAQQPPRMEPPQQQAQQLRSESQNQQAQQPRFEPRAQPAPQPRPEPLVQQAQQPRFVPRAQPAPQPRPEPQVQQAQQPRFVPHAQPAPQPQFQQAQQPRFEPRPQPIQQARPEPRPQMQQPRPEPRPKQVQQPRPQPQQQPQRAEQHQGGGNHDERHRG
ncbi:FecR protein [Burkholderia sp. SRS-W-2-2016]|uniref:DUF6600 domain-containing protein n=1 Tax=Burkholderia sp. SRS-W-2-2016 TaxID=1926878 RepID=UPI00094B011E|nr:DUF6600 domain-containing protein [Burkholderia sp. SRS-W-2-2016]OLL30258.1 FecR protein [Burkholderia sp. SRS-W-2-2016]